MKRIFITVFIFMIISIQVADAENNSSKTKSFNLSPDLNTQLGYCVGVFAYTMNGYALLNEAGGVKVMSLQYGRAYVAYFVSNLGKAGKEDPKIIIKEMYDLGQIAKKDLDTNPSQLETKLNDCYAIVNPIFANLSNAGAKIDKNSKESLTDTASNIAAMQRKQLGF